MAPDASTSASLARDIRVLSLRMVARSGASHIGSCLSVADILAVLYDDVLRVDPAQPEQPGRDRLILSKGHAAAALYATLALKGFFPVAKLDEYCSDGSPLTGHASHHVPGVEVSTGSLGHGLSIGCGMALGLRGSGPRVFVVMSDGECDEGSTWEAALFAAHHQLDNLTAVVDHNKIQSFGNVADVLGLEPFADKWRSFGWEVREIDGHDHAAIRNALLEGRTGSPLAVIAHTVKGKGVSFMEGRLAWHYRSPDPAELERALVEVEGRP